MPLKNIYSLAFVIAGFMSGSNAVAAECIGDQQAKSRFTFEVVPQFPAATVYATWTPLLESLGRASKLCFELIVPKDIPEFEADLSQGKPDFIYANPYQFIVAKKKQKYNPLVAEGKRLLSGILVVKASYPSLELKSLSGEKVAFPAPNSFGASLLTRYELSQKGVAITPMYVKTHGNVYRNVINGDALAGGGIRSTFEAEPKEIQDELKVIFTTQGYTPHPIATSSKVSENTRQRFLQAILECTTIPVCHKQLIAVQIENPRKVSNVDYKSVKVLNLEKFAQ
jgi:phosphonate transport system substrate-binding protein